MISVPEPQTGSRSGWSGVPGQRQHTGGQRLAQRRSRGLLPPAPPMEELATDVGRQGGSPVHDPEQQPRRLPSPVLCSGRLHRALPQPGQVPRERTRGGCSGAPDGRLEDERRAGPTTPSSRADLSPCLHLQPPPDGKLQEAQEHALGDPENECRIGVDSCGSVELDPPATR